MIKSCIKKMSQYNPPLEGRGASGYLLLDFNERTIPPGPNVKKALKEFIDSDRLQVYPEYGNLEGLIANYAKVKKGEAMVTNGGDQGIDIVCRAFLEKGDKAIIPCPSFAMHYQSARIQGAGILEPRYGKDGSFPLKETLGLLNDKKVRIVILCNPNNPLGSAIKKEDTEKIIKKAKKKNIAVMHDEAYFEFSGISCRNLISKYDNLYIVRTFSKAFGLVSARAGYVISQKKNIQQLLKIRGPYDVNMFAKVAVASALKDIKYMKNYVREVMEVSKPKLELFLRKKNIYFYPSAANFLFLELDRAENIAGKLKKAGILTRPKENPFREKRIRVSIGTFKETRRFMECFGKALGK